MIPLTILAIIVMSILILSMCRAASRADAVLSRERDVNGKPSASSGGASERASLSAADRSSCAQSTASGPPVLVGPGGCYLRAWPDQEAATERTERQRIIDAAYRADLPATTRIGMIHAILRENDDA